VSRCVRPAHITIAHQPDILALHQASGDIGSRDRTQEIAGDYHQPGHIVNSNLKGQKLKLRDNGIADNFEFYAMAFRFAL